MRPPALRIHSDDLIVDSFAGGGGASLGIEWALGRSPDIAITLFRAQGFPYPARHCTLMPWRDLTIQAAVGRPCQDESAIAQHAESRSSRGLAFGSNSPVAAHAHNSSGLYDREKPNPSRSCCSVNSVESRSSSRRSIGLAVFVPPNAHIHSCAAREQRPGRVEDVPSVGCSTPAKRGDRLVAQYGDATKPHAVDAPGSTSQGSAAFTSTTSLATPSIQTFGRSRRISCCSASPATISCIPAATRPESFSPRNTPIRAAA